MRIEELADAVGLDSSNISRLETGKQKSFTEQSLYKIAQALKVNITTLFDIPSQKSYHTEPDRINSNSDVYHLDLMEFPDVPSTGNDHARQSALTVRNIYYATEYAHFLFGNKPSSEVKMLLVTEDHMSSTLQPGDLLFVDITVRKYHGDGIYLFIINGETQVRRIQMLAESFLIISDNQTYQNQEISINNEGAIKILGKVMLSQSQKFKRHSF